MKADKTSLMDGDDRSLIRRQLARTQTYLRLSRLREAQLQEQLDALTAENERLKRERDTLAEGIEDARNADKCVALVEGGDGDE